MDIRLVPTLAVQRELYAMPAGTERFQWYLKQMLGDSAEDVRLPITAVNPMGKEHCLTAVETLQALEAEREVSRAIDDARKRLRKADGVAQVCINLVDDLAGGWTNRYFTEAQLRFGSDQAQRANRRQYVVVPAWTSETYTRDLIRRETMAAVYRHAWRARHGLARTLGEMLHAEGLALRFAGAEDDASSLLVPSLSAEVLSKARGVIDVNREAEEFSTQFACFFGDEAAMEVGYPRLAVAHRAGFAVALADAAKLDPVQMLLKPTSPNVRPPARAPLRLA